MKFYKEPLIVTISFTIGIILAVWAVIFLPKQDNTATVDHKTPRPVLIGNTTLADKKLQLEPGKQVNGISRQPINPDFANQLNKNRQNDLKRKARKELEEDARQKAEKEYKQQQRQQNSNN